MTTCTMDLYEESDLSYTWVCSNCETRFKDTRKFEKNTHCPKCEAEITDWVGYDEEEA